MFYRWSLWILTKSSNIKASIGRPSGSEEGVLDGPGSYGGFWMTRVLRARLGGGGWSVTVRGGRGFWMTSGFECPVHPAEWSAMVKQGPGWGNCNFSAGRVSLDYREMHYGHPVLLFLCVDKHHLFLLKMTASTIYLSVNHFLASQSYSGPHLNWKLWFLPNF